MGLHRDCVDGDEENKRPVIEKGNIMGGQFERRSTPYPHHVPLTSIILNNGHANFCLKGTSYEAGIKR